MAYQTKKSFTQIDDKRIPLPKFTLRETKNPTQSHVRTNLEIFQSSFLLPKKEREEVLPSKI